MGHLSNQSIAQKYFNRFGFREKIIHTKPSKNLGIIVVVPSFNEDYIAESIQSLNNCDQPSCDIEVIVVINNSEVAEESIKTKHKNTLKQLDSLETKYPLFVIYEDELPKKHAGVGLARKIGMDEAARRFSEIDMDGIITCFDADSFCDKNYLIELDKNLLKNECSGASIYFEHPTSGNDFGDENYQGIINYELFLRYYNLALRYAGLPYCYHTVGSSMAVKSNAYMLQGGMNKRKAGEDFYFLHKIIQIGSFTELNNTCVRPSARTSDRVPFGTGKAINDWIQNETKLYETYDFQVFEEIRKMVPMISEWYSKGFVSNSIPESISPFFIDENIADKIDEIRKNTTSVDRFKTRFFVWFDAFKMLKLVHWYRDHVSPNRSLLEMVNQLTQQIGERSPFENELDALQGLRKIERERTL